MNYRDKILSKIRGENDGLPLFVPRLDIWYNANKMRNTLPGELESCSLMEISQKLGVGFHSVIPTFMDTGEIKNIYHRGLGFYNHPTFPYYVDFSGIDFKAEVVDGQLKVTYESAYGPVTDGISYSHEFLHSGASIPDITEHALKGRSDYKKLADIFSRVKIKPAPENYSAYYNSIGESGVAVAFLSLAAGPMQHIMRDLIKFEQFIYDIYDTPKLIRELVEQLSEIYRQIIDSVLRTQAEIVLFGANYDSAITCPPFFKEHISPWLNYAAERVHSSGKFLLTHTDGENQGLIPLYLDCNIDIADSVCPAPMTAISLKKYRSYFLERVTIWGGIPSNIMLPSVCTDKDFRLYIDNTLEESRPFNNLIFSIADTTPPDTDFNRLLYICEKTGNMKA